MLMECVTCAWACACVCAHAANTLSVFQTYKVTDSAVSLLKSDIYKPLVSAFVMLVYEFFFVNEYQFKSKCTMKERTRLGYWCVNMAVCL